MALPGAVDVEDHVVDTHAYQVEKDGIKPHKPSTTIRAVSVTQEHAHDVFTSEVSVEAIGSQNRRRHRKPSIGNKELALHSLGGASLRTSSKEVIARTNTRADILIKTGCVESDSEGDHSPTSQTTTTPPGECRAKVNFIIGVLQKYSVPLVLGVASAMVWSNIHEPSYKAMVHWMPTPGFAVNGHNIDLHFVVNDIFMCFFFGLAIKEVTEALLPGGSLSPISRALNPLLATFGGVVGPAVFYLIFVTIFHAAGALDDPMCLPNDYHDNHSHDAHRRLAGGSGIPASAYSAKCSLEAIFKGWGIPTATDISLAWMFALLIFGPGHPAINFLLLLAILDDALGMIIIAAFYPDPDSPVDPIWLLLVLAAMLVAFSLRKAVVSRWQVYILLAAPLSWVGLFKAHVHPALSLVFVVPFMPATHAIEASGPHDLGRVSVSRSPTEKDDAEIFRKRSSVSLTIREAYVVASRSLKNIFGREEKAPLHVFEHTLKVPVDFGMFFFGLVNAGVKLGSVGGVTACVGLALLVGKTVGIAGMSALGPYIGAPLPKGLGTTDLIATAALGGVGLTVALFVANEAFVQPEMQGQAKMGAVLSTLCGLIAWLIKKVFGGTKTPKPEQRQEGQQGVERSPQIDEDEVGIFCKSIEVRQIVTDTSQATDAPETRFESDVCLASATSSCSLPDAVDELSQREVSGPGGFLA